MPRWNRFWVIREVVAAQHAWVLFGSDILQFGDFKQFYHTVRELAKITDCDVGPGWQAFIRGICLHAYRAHSVMKPWLAGGTPFLEALLDLFVYGTTQSTNPEDRFYAMAGLGVDVETMVGRVYYSASWRNVYTKGARSLLRNDCP